MISIPGYKTIDILIESPYIIVLRANRLSDLKVVILKLLKNSLSDGLYRSGFDFEFSIFSAEGFFGFLEVIQKTRLENHYFIEFENFEGISLEAFFELVNTSLTEKLKISVQLIKVIEELHNNGYLHRNINPQSFLIDPKTYNIKCVDLCLASVLTTGMELPVLKEKFATWLPYLCPEQTGRLAHAEDHRSDLYSLGILLYQLFTQRLPFVKGDLNEMVHSHLARVPLAPKAINSNVPEPVADIILKLLEKKPEARYQSAKGLKYDLIRCIENYCISQQISPFDLGTHDLINTFKIPLVIYGREREIDSIIQSFHRVKYKSELVLLYGNSGIGKSALIEEVCKRLRSEKHYFITGKCNQHLQDIPFGPVTLAFKGLIGRILKEPAEEIEKWRVNILNALGEMGQVVLDEIPELEQIIGRQKELEDIAVAETVNRNILVFTNFINVFARKEHPLIIFLDDLHWADKGTIDFIKNVTYGNNYLLIIGSFRDNETAKEEYLSCFLNEVIKTGNDAHNIYLAPLTFNEIKQLCSDTFSCSAKKCKELAENVFIRTLGNPLFIKEYLNHLHKEGIIYFNTDLNKWNWNLIDLQQHPDATSSLELIIHKIKNLSENAQKALCYASCIGSEFSLEFLSILMDKTEHETDEFLREGIIETLIHILREVPIAKQGLLQRRKQYRFIHDQIQQAAYSLLSDEVKRELHLNIGYGLLYNNTNTVIEQKIFEIAGHLDKGKSLISQKEEIVRLAKLLFSAGKKAKSSTAFDVAFEYFKKGYEFLEEKKIVIRDTDIFNSGSNEHNITCCQNYPVVPSLYMQAAETAYLTGRFEESSSLINFILPCFKSLSERVEAYLIQIQSYLFQKKNDAAIELALNVLKTLGVKIPAYVNNVHLLSAYVKCKWILRGKVIGDLGRLPEMRNPEILEAIRIIQNITATAYNTDPKLYALLVLKITFLSVKYGNASQSPLAYVTYGAIVNAIQADNTTCYEFGQLAVNLLHKVNDKKIKDRTLLIFNLINRNSREHIHNSLQQVKSSFIAGIESGDIEYAIYASNSYSLLLLLSGKNLQWVKDEMLACSSLPKHPNRTTFSSGNEALIQIVSNFLGENENPKALNGEFFKESDGFNEVFKSNQNSKIFVCHLFRSILCYILEDFSEAKIHAEKAGSFLQHIRGMVLEPLFYFYHSLLNFSLFEETSYNDYLRRAVRSKKKLKKWSIEVPVNYLHRFQMLEAEHQRVLKEDARALSYYDAAIKTAIENNHVHEEALANELAGKFWLRKGQSREAAVYLKCSVDLYKQWGCKLKVDQLINKYGSCITLQKYNGKEIESKDILSETFDLATLMKASTAISGEVVFDKLLQKLMKVVLENAGARTGYFILERSGKLTIEAKQTIDGERVELLKIPLKNSGALPESMIDFVFNTKENVIIHDAQENIQYKDELLLLNPDAKSVLCIPTMNQGKLIGVLYLENNLSYGVFTKDRVELLKLLSGQIAVSIENAMLYENLEQKVEERTTEIQIQKEEIERQKLLVEEKSRFKEQFFANMSHEIRTPMTAIIGMSELIFDTRLNDQQLEYAKGIKYSSENLLAIINDILDFSKIEAGKFTFINKPFQIKDRLNRLSYILSCLADQKGLVLEIHHAHNVSEQLIGDPLRLHQILLNLASNAIKFTKAGFVKISYVKVSEDDHSEVVLFKVEDTGMGIPEDKIQYIFETFTRIDDEVNHQHSGTGLGLFIAKKLIEEQGGEIKVQSQLNKGTTFEFSLTFKKSVGYQSPKSNLNLQNLRGTKILLVEDTLFNQIVAEEILKKMIPDVCVTIAENGAIALEKFQEQTFDIVLMDVKMPVMDGYTASGKIRQGIFNNTVPILAFTANASPLEAEKCKESGMDDYISKPIEPDKLKEKISKLIVKKQELV